MITIGPFPLYRVTIKPSLISSTHVTLGGYTVLFFLPTKSRDLIFFFSQNVSRRVRCSWKRKQQFEINEAALSGKVKETKGEREMVASENESESCSHTRRPGVRSVRLGKTRVDNY